MTELAWFKPPETLRVVSGEVHIWGSFLDVDDETIKRLFTLLSAHEQQQALRFHFDRHCRQHIAAHGLVRSILGKYLDIEPKLLAFCTNPYGKPYLFSDQKNSAILFNVSHSHNLSVIAISSGLEVGIDIEYTNREMDFMEIANRFFSKGEINKLKSLSEDLQKDAFFRCWTRKEAYLKGKGRGLSMALDRFEVSLLPNDSPSILASDDSPADVYSWHLYDITPLSDYIGALSVADEIDTVKYFNAASLLGKSIEPY